MNRSIHDLYEFMLVPEEDYMCACSVCYETLRNMCGVIGATFIRLKGVE